MDNQIIFGVTDEQSGYKDEILLTNMSNRTDVSQVQPEQGKPFLYKN